MQVPFHKEIRIGAYVLKQKLMGRKRYPLVLMLEPLFRCNLACFGCGKIDYPDPILNRRLSVKECLDAVDECGAPMVAIPGGEPLIHREIGEIVKGIVARKKFVSLCTNALLLEKKLHLVRAFALSVLLRSPRRAARASRQVGLPGGRIRSRGVGNQGRQGEGLCRQRQRHDLRRAPARGHRRLPRLRQANSASASRSRRATPTSALPTRSISSIAARPRSCSATSSRAARGRRWTFVHSGLVPRFPRRQPDLSLHAVGHADAQHLRLAEALLSAGRRLRQIVS